MSRRIINDFIGNGLKITYFGRLLITGTHLIPNSFVIFDKTNFAGLTFEIDEGNLINFDENNGEITFLRSGIMHIVATLNIDTALGTAKVEISTQRFKNSIWSYLNARIAELPVIGQQQMVLAGTINDMEKGQKLRFEVCGPAGAPTFKTQILSNSSIVVAGILDFFEFTL